MRARQLNCAGLDTIPFGAYVLGSFRREPSRARHPPRLQWMVTWMACLMGGSALASECGRKAAPAQFTSGRSRIAVLLLSLPAILSAQHAVNRNPGPMGGATAAATAPTFCKQVAPILFKHCVECHQPGEIASTVSFLSYDTARPWARAIREKVLLREMPPWPADPQRSVKFRNDTRLSRQDIQT